MMINAQQERRRRRDSVMHCLKVLRPYSPAQIEGSHENGTPANINFGWDSRCPS